MIEVKKNNYEVPTEVREEVVQAICDAFLSRCVWSVFHPTSASLYRRATLLVVGHQNGEWYGFHNEPFTNDRHYRVRGVEMKEAFKELRKAGYHIFKVYEFRGWPGYRVSEKPYMEGGMEVEEFTDFID